MIFLSFTTLLLTIFFNSFLASWPYGCFFSGVSISASLTFIFPNFLCSKWIVSPSTTLITFAYRVSGSLFSAYECTFIKHNKIIRNVFLNFANIRLCFL